MEITPYDFSGKTVRILTDGKGEQWWIAADVCRILGLTNPTMAVNALFDDEKSTLRITEGGPERLIVDEAGLYSLIMRSKKKTALKFKRWVTHDILPTIRKTGSYSLEKQHQLPQTYAEALRALADKSEAEEKLLIEQKENKPKVDYFDNVSDATNAHSFNSAAKLLGWGRNTLMARLRADRILMGNNVPYQKHLDSNRFLVKERLFEAEGMHRITHTTFVTGKGLQWLQGKYIKQGA